ncbi:MAG: hypothetical protein ACRD1X_22185 [Vicinamibacteria bacterium]
MLQIKKKTMHRRSSESLASWKRRLEQRSARMRKKPGASWRMSAVKPNGEDLTFATHHHVRELEQVPRGEPHAHKISRGVGEYVFDELVVDDWLHLEQMDTRVWWLRVSDVVLGIQVPRSGPVKVTVSRDRDRLFGTAPKKERRRSRCNHRGTSRYAKHGIRCARCGRRVA